MPICPRCGSNIKHLLNYCKVYEAYIYDGNRHVRDKSRDITDTACEVEYVCPVCQETMFHDEGAAERSLRNEIRYNHRMINASFIFLVFTSLDLVSA